VRGLAAQPTPAPIAAGLPAVVASDDFVRRFTDALDDVLAAAVVAYDNLPAYLDPGTAPADFLDWLGHWVGAPPDDRDGPARETALRSLLPVAADLGARRGTASALAEEVSRLCGVDVEVRDGGCVVTSLTPGATTSRDGTASDGRVEVVVHGDGDRALVRRLVRRATPAHVQVEITFDTHDDTDLLPRQQTGHHHDPPTADLRGGDPT
jgi:phage tail-like protein